MSRPAERIDTKEAHEHLELNSSSMLVCAYDDEEKFEQKHLKGLCLTGRSHVCPSG